jgi:tRNA pseudouridine55 synthase
MASSLLFSLKLQTMNDINGILLIDKPANWTSHDVVAKVRSILRQAESELSANSSQPSAPSPKVKVGHTGTLDPFATGLLILMIGNYTKRAGEFSKLDKTYEAELILGSISSTGDVEGEIMKNEEWRMKNEGEEPGIEEIKNVLASFVGEIEQVPHKFSAIKINGQRAYKLARQGKEVKLEPRKVKVESLEVREYSYPTLKIVTEVSSGTYIRSLAEDIGEKIGTGGYLSSLRRTMVGKFDIKDATSLENLDFDFIRRDLPAEK